LISAAPYLVEKVAGESYEEFVQENIFGPRGMKDSGYDSNSAIIPRRAAGHAKGEGDTPENAGSIHMSIPFSAGVLYSTTEYLLRWEQGLFGGQLISAASLAKMTTPFKDDYAFGVVCTRSTGTRSAGIEGFKTFLAYHPEDKLTVVALSNLEGGGTLPEIVTHLAAVAHGEKGGTSCGAAGDPCWSEDPGAYWGPTNWAPKINMMITL
jgi:CubicO group peptidase (beta-lactamase class C family)